MDIQDKQMGEFTTVKVYTKTRDKLAKEGKYNESMADIIERIFNEWREGKRFENVAGAYPK